MYEPPSCTTKTLPVSVEASSWFSEPCRASAAAASRSWTARTNDSLSASVEAATLPLASKRTAASTCEEISVRSARACSAVTALNDTGRRAQAKKEARAEVLRRPGNPPRGDDRVFRAARLRAADLPLAVPSRLHRPTERVELPGPRDQAGPPGDADRGHRAPRRDRAGQRGRARAPRRGVPAVDRALALQRARVRVQHRLRAAEPSVPPGEGARARAARGLAGDDRRLDARSLRVHRLRVLRAHEREPPYPRRAAGSDPRVRAAPDVLPDPARLPALCGDQPGAEGVRLARDPAGLALRDVERDRVRRRAELVADLRTRGARRGARRTGVEARCELAATSAAKRPPLGVFARRGSARADSRLAQLAEGARRPRPVRVPALPVVSELRDGVRLALGDEDRVVAEALAATRLARDRPLDGAGPATLLALGGQRDELADVARPPVLDALEDVEQRGDAVFRPARRLDPRSPAQG